MKIKKIVNTAMVAAIVAGMHSLVLANGPEMEKCYGVVKAGKNDCATKGGNSCAAQVKQNNDPNAWIFMPKGTCSKIVGGKPAPADAETKTS